MTNKTPPAAASLPQQTRLARFAPASFKPEARTVDLVWSTGADVNRYDYWEGQRYIERLNMEPGSIDLSRLNSRAPLLNSHSARELDDVIGVVESAVVEGGEGRATVRFSARPEIASIVADVEAGILCNISVGYTVEEYRITQNKDGPDIWEAMRWTPMELSLVAIPADASAQIRSPDKEPARFPVVFTRAADPANPKEHDMTLPSPAVDPAANTTTGTTVLPPNQMEAARSAPPSKEFMTQVRSAAAACGLTVDDAMDVISETTDITQARSALLARAETQQQARQGNRPMGSPSVSLVADHTDPAQVRVAMADALAARSNPLFRSAARSRPGGLGRAETYMRFGFSALFAELARIHNEDSGKRLDPNDKGEFVQALRSGMFSRAGFMQTTSDFSSILGSSQNKILQAAYEVLPKSYRAWAQQVTFTDFKAHNMIRLGDFPSLVGRVPSQGGGPIFGSIGEKNETVTPVNYATGVIFSQEAMVNDDLGAFEQIGTLAASRAATDENTLVYSVLSQNSGDGPTLTEGAALMFTTGRGNKAGTATAITLAAVNLARAAIRAQQGLGGQPLNLDPFIILCGVAKELEASQLTVSLTPAQTTNANPYSSRLMVISDPNVAGNGWYLASAPIQSPIVYGYINGMEGPMIETELDFDTKALKFRLGLSFAAGARDFRGMYRNAGA